MIRMLIRLGIILGMTITLLHAPIQVNAQSSGDYVPDEVVIKLYDANDLAGVAADHFLDATPLDQFGTRPIYLMKILDGTPPPDRTSELSADPRIVYAEPNFIGRAPGGQQRVSWAKGDESAGFENQWAARMIRLPEAHTVTRGEGVIVAVLDTGVDMSHPALANRLIDGYDFVDMDNDPSEVDVPGEDLMFGHGTHVAGLVALVAPEAQIMPVRILDSNGNGNIWVLAEALAYAINPDGDPTTDDGADVINLSLSTSYQTQLLSEIEQDVACSDDVSEGEADEDDVEEDEVEENEMDEDGCLADQIQHGAVIVAAAGNDASSEPQYPAAEGVTGVLLVGASTPGNTLAAFSNYGSWIQVTAPGEGIYSSVPGGGYAYWSGTSMSAPLAAGEAALIRAAYPAMDVSSVAARVIETSTYIGGSVPYRIDAAAALGIKTVKYKGEYKCGVILGPVVIDNLLVSKGKTCSLIGTRILGNIKVEEGAVLYAVGVTVNGSLQAKKANLVDIANMMVYGTIQIEEGVSARLDSSTVMGDIQVMKNTGSLTILNNIVQSNLQCKENVQLPVGGGNIVSGNKEEQCSGL